jgi:hypothetical protein
MMIAGASFSLARADSRLVQISYQFPADQERAFEAVLGAGRIVIDQEYSRTGHRNK